MNDFLLIKTPADAEALASAWTAQTPIAVDTEFMRESTYRAQLCLLQLSNGEQVACIDTLALGGLGPFAELLLDPAVLKVFHSARQDLEVLHDHLEQVPAPVWDTQVAAALLGYPDQVGYTQLTTTELGVQLPKDHARTDWSRRPLSAAQLQYAAADVLWLLPLADKLRAALRERGREQWAADESANLCNPALYAFDDEGAWRRVKGIHRLDQPAFSRLVMLAAWREREARDRNQPRRWILKDEELVILAAANPQSIAALSTATRLPANVVNRFGGTLVALLKGVDTSRGPELPLTTRLDPGQEQLVSRLMACLRDVSTAEGVSAPLIATRRDIESLVRGRRDLPVLQGWRRELAGDELLRITAAALG